MTDSIIYTDPITGKFTISALKRKSRPFQSTARCPFCVRSEEIPHEFDGIKSLPNKYAALHPDNANAKEGMPGRGVCEVILYSSNHTIPLRDRSEEFIQDFIEHLQTRDKEIREKHDFVEFIFPFENYGKEIGVSMEHPHGQLYALPIVPDVINKKKKALRAVDCVYCHNLDDFIIIRETEIDRIIVPKYGQWPIQLHIVTRNHYSGLGDLTSGVISNLAQSVKLSLTSIYNLYSKDIPYIMSFYQAPVGVMDFHFHIEIISPQLSESKLKYRAGLETSLDVFINSTDMNIFAARIKELMQ